MLKAIKAKFDDQLNAAGADGKNKIEGIPLEKYAAVEKMARRLNMGDDEFGALANQMSKQLVPKLNREQKEKYYHERSIWNNGQSIRFNPHLRHNDDGKVQR